MPADQVRMIERVLPKVKSVGQFADVVGDPDVQIVVELIGGIEPARTIQLAALKAELEAKNKKS